MKPIFRHGNASFCPQLRKIWNEFDLVVLHYPFYGGAEPLVWGKPKSGGAKLMLVYHMDTFGNGLIKAIFDLHRRFCVPKIMSKADMVVGTSSDYLQNSQGSPLLVLFKSFHIAFISAVGHGFAQIEIVLPSRSNPFSLYTKGLASSSKWR